MKSQCPVASKLFEWAVLSLRTIRAKWHADVASILQPTWLQHVTEFDYSEAR